MLEVNKNNHDFTTFSLLLGNVLFGSRQLPSISRLDFDFLSASQQSHRLLVTTGENRDVGTAISCTLGGNPRLCAYVCTTTLDLSPLHC